MKKHDIVTFYWHTNIVEAYVLAIFPISNLIEVVLLDAAGTFKKGDRVRIDRAVATIVRQSNHW